MQHEYNERNARKLMDLMQQRLDLFAVLVNGPNVRNYKGTLAKMLEDGKFPATESKALKDALDKCQDALADLQMALLMPFEMQEHEPGEIKLSNRAARSGLGAAFAALAKQK